MKTGSRELNDFIDESIAVAARHGYYPHEFKDQRDRKGTVKAIADLVTSPEIQSGFKRLAQLGLLD